MILQNILLTFTYYNTALHLELDCVRSPVKHDLGVAERPAATPVVVRLGCSQFFCLRLRPKLADLELNVSILESPMKFVFF